MNRKILIVVITYNMGRAISHCLDSLIKQTYQNYQLLLIDNNSSPANFAEMDSYIQSHTLLQEKTTIIKNSENLGFSKAVNIGLKKALKSKEFSTVLLLNQDIYFESNLLEKGIDVLEKYPKAGAVLPKILYPDGKVWWVGTRLLSNKELILSSYYGIVKHFHKNKKIKLNKNTVKDLDALTGCAVFLRLDAVRKIGLFDEKYFMYAEDIDYSQRLKQKGFTILLFTSSIVYHEVEDQEINLTIVSKRLKKYKIYLTSVGLYLLQYKPWIFPIWFLKLPFTLIYSYVKRRSE